MGYDPDRHHRRSIRKKGYDYSTTGMYFVTICTRNREHLLSKIVANGGGGLAPVLSDPVTPILTRIGEIVDRHWKNIPDFYSNVVLDEYVIMPNHFHGILVMNARNIDRAISRRATARVAPPLGAIIGSFKSRCVIENLKYIRANGLNEIGKIWQRNYHDQIVRNADDLHRIRQYIRDNPMNWARDKDNPEKIR